MKKLKLKNTDFTIPVMGQGMMGIGGYFERDASKDSHSIDILRKGFEKGLTFVDTAEIYGAGHSEEVLGIAIKDCRESIQIGTKFKPENNAPELMIDSCKRSLERLQTDYIDLYQTHWPSNTVPFESTLDGFNALLDKGLIKYIGLSNATVNQVKLASEKLPKGRFVSLQQAFNIADRFAEENLLPGCQKEGRVMIAYSPLLEGKMVPDDERRASMETLASECSLTLPQLILSWLVSHKNLAIIPKTATESHMLSNIEAVNFGMTEEIYERIDALYEVKVENIAPELIEPADADGRKVYKTPKEAIANENEMSPSPVELSKDFLAGELFRPIKVSRTAEGKPYALKEGRLRYWAWVIAFNGENEVPCIVV